MNKNSHLFWNDLKVSFRIGLIVTGIFMFSGIELLAYDFSDIRKTMHNDLASSNTTGLNRRIAIVYNIPDRESVKQRTNLVKLKKDLSLELLKSFEIVDPIIVQQVITTNRLTYHQIDGNSSILKQFADRADSSQILFVDLRLKADYLQTNMKLVNNRHEQISDIQVQLPFERDQVTSYQTARVVTQSSAPQNSVFESFSMDFSPRSFVAGQNDSWIYFTPTAEIIPQLQSIGVLVWLKHLAEVDLQLVRLRYDVRLFEVLQMGVQSNAIVEKTGADTKVPNTKKEQGHHSTYLTLKYQVSDGSSIPISLAIGVKRRLAWDENNTDFSNSSGSVNNKNDRYNQLTLLAAATGKFEALGLLYNLYVDSQTIGAGAKFLLTSEVKLFADSLVYHHQDPQIGGDSAVGIELFNPAGVVSLSYQFSTEQTQLGLVFDF
ncbi:MAG: hypothetical protein HN580_10185 [Deltaproteobacteria bacterium]|nr:hypothetical protein [Deltaproteobacteria bacterium]